MAITYELVSRSISMKVSTVNCMMQYIHNHWKPTEEQNRLQDIGYAGLFYITLASYLEHTIRSIIIIRIDMYLNIQMQNQTFGIFDCSVDGTCIPNVDFRPYNDIKIPLSRELQKKVEQMNRINLFNIYDKLFSIKVTDILGCELIDTWTALGTIRNTYAHGADMVTEYDGLTNTRVKDTFADTVTGQLITTQLSEGKDNGIPYMYLFTNEVMRHFYTEAQQICTRLYEAITNPAERKKFDFRYIKPLSDLPK